MESEIAPEPPRGVFGGVGALAALVFGQAGLEVGRMPGVMMAKHKVLNPGRISSTKWKSRSKNSAKQ
jgi:hypothetical protein